MVQRVRYGLRARVVPPLIVGLAYANPVPLVEIQFDRPLPASAPHPVGPTARWLGMTRIGHRLDGAQDLLDSAFLNQICRPKAIKVLVP